MLACWAAYQIECMGNVACRQVSCMASKFIKLHSLAVMDVQFLFRAQENIQSVLVGLH